jgi:hypothetical protein
MAYGIQAPSGNWRNYWNVAFGGLGTSILDIQDLHYKRKRIKLGDLGSGAWLDGHGAVATDPTFCTVAYSCDGSGNGSYCGAADYINASTKFVFAAGGSNHSYLALNWPGMGTGMQTLEDYASYYTNGYNWSCAQEAGAQPSSTQYGGIYVTQGGDFQSNGGIVTRRCWSAKEVQTMHRAAMSYAPSTSCWGGQTGSFSGKLHTSMKADGSAFIEIVCIAGFPVWYFYFGKPIGPVHTETSPDHTWNGDDLPWVAACDYVSAGSSNAFTRTNFFANANRWVSRLASNAAPTNNAVSELRWTSWGSNLNANFWSTELQETQRSLITNGYKPFPLGWCTSQSGYTDPLLGTMEDAYMIGANATTGSRLEDATSSGWTYTVLGNLLIPGPYGVSMQLS